MKPILCLPAADVNINFASLCIYHIKYTCKFTFKQYHNCALFPLAHTVCTKRPNYYETTEA